MQLTGLLIEYFTIGSIALIWIVPLLIYTNILGNDYKALIPLFIPSIYVLGMLSDYLGEALLHKRKEKIKRKVRTEAQIGMEISSQEMDTKILTYMPEVAKEISIRSTRDRISRGVLIHIPLIGLGAIIRLEQKYSFSIKFFVLSAIAIIFTSLLTLAIYSMWRRYQDLSYKYEANAYNVLLEKLDKEAQQSYSTKE